MCIVWHVVVDFLKKKQYWRKVIVAFFCKITDQHMSPFVGVVQAHLELTQLSKLLLCFENMLTDPACNQLAFV